MACYKKLLVFLLVALAPICAYGQILHGIVGSLSTAGTTSVYDRIFDGQANYLSSAATFTPGAVTTMSIFFRANLAPAFAMTNGQILFESSANYNSNNGSWYVGTDNTPLLYFNAHTSAGYTTNQISLTGVAAGWHDYLLTIETNGAGTAYIDGVSKTVTNSTSGSGNWTAYTLYMMARAGTSGFAGAQVGQAAIWSTILTSGNATTLHSAANACTAITSGLVACWPFAGASPETDASGNGHSLTVYGSQLEASTSSSYWSKGACAPNGSTSIASVQWEAGAAGSVTTESQTLTSPTVGHVIVVGSRWDNLSTTASVADGKGNSYTAVTCSPTFPLNFGTASRAQMWVAPVTSGGSSDIVTITFSPATTSYALLDVWELSGVNTTTPVDVCSAFTGAAGGSSAIELAGVGTTTTHANERILGAFFAEGSNSSWLPHPCATEVAQEQDSYWEYRDVTSTWSPYIWAGGGNVASPPAWAGVLLGLVSQ